MGAFLPVASWEDLAWVMMFVGFFHIKFTTFPALPNLEPRKTPYKVLCNVLVGLA